MATRPRRPPQRSPRTTTPAPTNYGAHLVNLAKEVGPDAFVLGLVPLAGIYAVTKGADTLMVLGFCLAVALIYAGLALMRMKHARTTREGEIDAQYRDGEARLNHAINRTTGGRQDEI